LILILAQIHSQITMFEAKFEPCDPDDPRRCQYVTPTVGQCVHKACDNSNYCPAHGGNKGFQAQEKKELRNYQLNKFKVRIGELGNNSKILSLKDEIGILRLLIEEKVNKCQDPHDLILMSGPLSDLIMKVERVVCSCNKLESRLGNLLDKSEILQFAQTVVSIIGRHVTDENALNLISTQILEALDD